jgi:hypothetical protein
MGLVDLRTPTSIFTSVVSSQCPLAMVEWLSSRDEMN